MHSFVPEASRVHTERQKRELWKLVRMERHVEDNWMGLGWTVGEERHRGRNVYKILCGPEAVGALGRCQGHSIGGRYLRKLFLEPGGGRETQEPCFI